VLPQQGAVHVVPLAYVVGMHVASWAYSVRGHPCRPCGLYCLTLSAWSSLKYLFASILRAYISSSLSRACCSVRMMGYIILKPAPTHEMM
jgi:hypothetical protein